MKTQTKKSRFSHIALALALSVGTVGGMASFLALTEVAQAKGNGGGGAGGAGGGNGGEPAPAAINNNRPAINRAPPVIDPPQRARIPQLNCDGSREMIENQNCRHNARSTPRIVRINGFANCAVVQQIPSPNGGPAEFYCLRPM